MHQAHQSVERGRLDCPSERARTQRAVSTGRSLGALAHLSAGLARMRRLDDAAAMTSGGPAEVCRSLGFARVILFRVDGDRLIAESAHVDDDPDGAAVLLVALRATPPRLNQLPVESEIVRRRESPLLGEAVTGLRRVSQLPRTADAAAYASAPIVSSGRVTGFLHADRYGQPE
jgi:LuxR family transcriptional regulator, regulator of acetate metabolism